MADVKTFRPQSGGPSVVIPPGIIPGTTVSNVGVLEITNDYINPVTMLAASSTIEVIDTETTFNPVTGEAIVTTTINNLGDLNNIAGVTALTIAEPIGNSTFAGNSATATELATAREIGGVLFDGTTNIDLPGVNISGNQNTTGNADTATSLATPRNVGGVAFDGTGNINLPGVNIAGNQNTTGNSATSTSLATARNIGGVAFDGTADISLPGVDIAGNQNTTGNADTATLADTIEISNQAHTVVTLDEAAYIGLVPDARTLYLITA